MPFAAANGLTLCYELDGNRSDPPIVLVGGLGVQLIDWPDYFISPLVDAGLQVIRFDNRDVGLSTTFDGGTSDVAALIASLDAGEEIDACYTLAEMAADVVGLLDALELDAAHLVGVSMGAMVAQTAAILFPDRVLSLTSIMGSTGAPDVGLPTPDALAALLAPGPPAANGRDEHIAHSVDVAKTWASPGHFDERRLVALFEASWDRVAGPQADSTGRQLGAILVAEPRDDALAKLDLPALVVHGCADQLIDHSGGERTAACIPAADLLLVEGMGHDLVPAFVGDITQSIAELVERAQAT